MDGMSKEVLPYTAAPIKRGRMSRRRKNVLRVLDQIHFWYTLRW